MWRQAGLPPHADSIRLDGFAEDPCWRDRLPRRALYGSQSWAEKPIGSSSVQPGRAGRAFRRLRASRRPILLAFIGERGLLMFRLFGPSSSTTRSPPICPREQTARCAATQPGWRDSEPSHPHAWKSLPSWAGGCRQQCGRRRLDPHHGQARESHHHRSRGLARDHGLPARGSR